MLKFIFLLSFIHHIFSETQITTTGKICAMSTSERIDCGYSGINQPECEGRDCCWKECYGCDSSIPWCFYGKCPTLDYIINNNMNEITRECFDTAPEGFYLDPNANKYKKCFENCKKCIQAGNNQNNNCQECKSGYSFFNEYKYGVNCYQNCQNFYYFDTSNIYHCVGSCPALYNKKISIKKKCIDDCKNDDTYKYEYNNECYISCPNEKYELEDKTDKICYDKTPIGYYLDINSNIFRKCFESCKYCLGLGDENNHNCLECKEGYAFFHEYKYEINCYKICDYYYYFDASFIYHCTEDNNCPVNFNKSIDNKKKCIDDCKNDDTYQYEYNNECYIACPNEKYELINKTDKICYDKTPEGYYLDENNEIFKNCFETCKYCKGEGDEINNNCTQCISNYDFYKNPNNIMNCYEICDNYYYFDEISEYHCIEICPDKFSKLIPDKRKCIDFCFKDDIYLYEYNNTCYETCPNGTRIFYDNNYICLIDNVDSKIFRLKEYILKTHNNATDLEIQDELVKNIQQIFLDGFDTNNIDKGNDSFIIYNGVIYTITSNENQKSKKFRNETTINLGKCEKKLKEEYNISLNDSLYIFKIDTKIENIQKIEYELYYQFIKNNNSFTKLDLSICEGLKVDIYIPINISSEDIDKYNMSSDLYNDLCNTLTTESGTDQSLKDRRENYKKNNISVCEENCFFELYSNITNKALCSCNIKLKLPLISEIKIDKNKLFSNFKDINNIANIKMLKCIYLLFDIKNIFNNYANYMLIILLVLEIITIFVYFLYDNKKNIFLVKNIIKIKAKIDLFQEKNKIKSKNIHIKRKNKKRSKTMNAYDLMNTFIKKKMNKRLSVGNLKLKNNNQNTNIVNFLNVNIKSTPKSNKIHNDNNHKFIKPKMYINTKKIYRNNIIETNYDNFKYKLKAKKALQSNYIKLTKKEKLIFSYNDKELNTLVYLKARLFDKRTYCQYYLSLLKTQHILLFTFCNHKDYNSQMIKIYLFFYTYSINLVISSIFYTDNTMHKIYVDNGSFDFEYQFPQMVYSFIISSILLTILQTFGLYENNIMKIKNRKNILNIWKNELKKINIKIILLFIITFILLFFLWIYLGCFCAVYKNTQNHLLKDVTLSFALSFISPFCIYLFPGIFRIASLRSKSHRNIMYNFSKIIQVF